VGKSLTNEGGQNPLEPAMLGSAVLSGPNIDNFRDAYQHLVKKGGARMVRDVEMLAKAVHYLMINDLARRKMVEAGHDAMDEMRGALAKTVKALEPYVNPLTVSARLQPKTAAAGAAR
ncbi:MAG: 3-deoxy-D-manno-octulosonic acid transferase, partial [Novosphingobium sp.]